MYRKAGLAVAAVLALSACGGHSSHESVNRPNTDNVATAAQVKADHDAFGIKEIKPTLKGGTIWTSDWAGTRNFTGVDPQDPWFHANHGSASYEVRDGVLYISGDIPRMYVYDPEEKRQWRDVEVTMYFKRIKDEGIASAGMTMVARANHLNTESEDTQCDTRGLGARMRYDGTVDFEKETSHPNNEATHAKRFWEGSLPKNEWIGVKYLVFDTDSGVHMQLWTDLTDGKDGGDWKLTNSATDTGDLLGSIPCAPGIDPRMPLTNDPSRDGSESGKPNLTVYFRSDGVGKNGLAYKWGSIREISTR